MASGSRGCFTLGGFLIELASNGSTPRFPSRLLLFFGLAARDLLRCRGLSCGFLAFGLRSCSLGASCFLTERALDAAPPVVLSAVPRHERLLDELPADAPLPTVPQPVARLRCAPLLPGERRPAAPPPVALLALPRYERLLDELPADALPPTAPQPVAGFGARRYFLASGVLPLRLQTCRSQLRGLLGFSLLAQPRHVPLLP